MSQTCPLTVDLLSDVLYATDLAYNMNGVTKFQLSIYIQQYGYVNCVYNKLCIYSYYLGPIKVSV